MYFFRRLLICSSLAIGLALPHLNGAGKPLPETMQKIMNQPKYKHATWGIFVKDLESGEVLYDQNSDKLFSPASTSKLFSVEALLHAYGDDYRFKTPVYAVGKIENGQLQGNLVLVAQGDLTMGGRQSTPNTLSYTKLDHINANEVPGVILTKENPLAGFNSLAKQIYQKGIKEINGDVIIDDSLFESIQKRGLSISPILVNENLIDITLNPKTPGQKAELSWRPQVPGYEVINEVDTVENDNSLELTITSAEAGHRIVVKGTIPLDQHDVVRTFSIKDPSNFARAALIQSLEAQGIKLNIPKDKTAHIPASVSYKALQPIALWTSPPLTEYAKLILKVSHNLGADLVPLLLAAQQGKRTFDEGMLLFGNFVTQDVKISPDAFVFGDAAGGNENRLTPQVEVQLLEFVYKEPSARFKNYFDALPILGKDGSLEDFAKNSPGAGKIRSKPGTGVAFNLATGKFFLITQALAGYIEGKNGHLYAYMLGVNNGMMPTIMDIFLIFEDVSELSSIIYTQTD
jgi:D-alanyl-D-alanine carboxypeptidase/D-alanyl-D-alanine-endopeptidase (penicillin-binding protein 4)